MKDQEYFKLFEGCGSGFKGGDGNYCLDYVCGKSIINDIHGNKHSKFCPTCKAKISQAKIEKRKQIKMLEVLKQVVWGKIDWMRVFKDAYENRKTSWNEIGHIREWRNATDEVLFALWHQIEELFGFSNKIKQLQEEIKHE